MNQTGPKRSISTGPRFRGNFTTWLTDANNKAAMEAADREIAQELWNNYPELREEGDFPPPPAALGSSPTPVMVPK